MKQLLYEKIVNESNIKEIDNFKVRRSFWVYYFSIMSFSLCFTTFETFIGIYFYNLMAQVLSYLIIICGLFLLYFYFRFLDLIIRYKVFKNIYLGIFLSSIYVILSVIFLFVSIFTNRVEMHSNTSFSVHFNPGFYFFIYLPLFIIFVFVNYYLFLKCFAKYVKKKDSDFKKEN